MDQEDVHPQGTASPDPARTRITGQGLSAVELAARRGIGPMSMLASEAWHGQAKPCVSCGQLMRRTASRCDQCGQDMGPQMLWTMQRHSGPWYVLEHVRPFPGVSLERLVRQIRRTAGGGAIYEVRVSGLDLENLNLFRFDAEVVPDPEYNVGDFVWLDKDGDGEEDPGEPGIPGVAIKLWNSDQTEELGMTTTDDSGMYVFQGLEPGEYLVECVPENADPGGPLEGLAITLPVQELIVTNDGGDGLGGRRRRRRVRRRA